MRYAPVMGVKKKLVRGAVGYAIAGPVGALVGIASAGPDDPGYDMSDIPIGVHVEAKREDDEAGFGYDLQFLSEVPQRGLVVAQLLFDTGNRLSGRAPFADSDGHFFVGATIKNSRAYIYVPHGAASYESPKYVSLEVVVFRGTEDDAESVGKGILDADLPAAKQWQPAAYLRPLSRLAGHVRKADNSNERRALVGRLATELGFFGSPEAEGMLDDATLDLIDRYAASPLDLTAAVKMTRFRFSGMPAPQVVALVETVVFGEEQDQSYEAPSASQRARLDELSGLLSR